MALLKYDLMDDFNGAIPTITAGAPFIDTAANVDINKFAASAVASVAYITAPVNGVITEIGFAAEDACVQNGTAFITFTGLNLLGAGVGSTALLSATAHVNTTDANASALNGGSDLTAKKFWPLVLSGTAANLRVTKGDVLEITATVSSTPAIVDAPQCRITFATASGLTTSVVNRTAGSPLIQRVANAAWGEGIAQLSATNEVNDVFYTTGDQLQIPAIAGFHFWARVKVGTVTTAQSVVIGMGSAFNATLDSVVSNLWFKLAASLAVVIEGDDGTTDTDDQASSPATTLTADTYYTFHIDATNLSAVRFFIDDVAIGTVSVPLLSASTPLQPIIGISKASGTGTVSLTVDYWRVKATRA